MNSLVVFVFLCFNFQNCVSKQISIKLMNQRQHHTRAHIDNFEVTTMDGRKPCHYFSAGKRIVGNQKNSPRWGNLISFVSFRPLCSKYVKNLHASISLNKNKASFKNITVTTSKKPDNLSYGTKRQSEPVVNVETPIIAIENGLIRGIIATASDGEPYLAYRGIPYAMPLKQRRRFAPPKPYNKTWEGVRDMTSYKSGCIGLNKNVFTMVNSKKHYNVTGAEDCLYLNVHIRGRSMNDSRAVIFFLHGGGFSYGSPDEYEGPTLMERDSIVYVTAAYRVGPMGFLSTGDEVVPGNNGLKDQLLALKWVNRNIHAFGGNPKKIQIAGVDAGAVSVHFMLIALSPSDLFTTAISFSGTVYCPWAYQSRKTAVERTKKLAGFLKCPTENSTAIVDCLRNKTAFEVVDSMRHFKTILYHPFAIFTPVDDSPFRNAYFPSNPIISYQSRPPITVPWVTSISSKTFLYSLDEIIMSDNSIAELEKNWHEYLPSLLFYNETCEDVAFALRALYAIPLRQKKYTALKDFVTSRLFIFPALKSSFVMSQIEKARAFVYFYYYRHPKAKEPVITDYLDKNLLLIDDVEFIFKTPHWPIVEDTQIVARALLDLVINFAYKGQPSSTSHWPFVTPTHTNYQVIGNRLREVGNAITRKTSVSKFDYLFDYCSL